MLEMETHQIALLNDLEKTRKIFDEYVENRYAKLAAVKANAENVHTQTSGTRRERLLSFFFLFFSFFFFFQIPWTFSPLFASCWTTYVVSAPMKWIEKQMSH